MNDEFYLVRYKIELQDGWRESIAVIPHIQFPAEWLVQIIPPFGGAMARFRVKLPSGEEKSIYLDFYDRLGFYGEKPYWEVYPFDGDVGRCDMADVPELLRMIAHDPKPLTRGGSATSATAPGSSAPEA